MQSKFKSIAKSLTAAVLVSAISSGAARASELKFNLTVSPRTTEGVMLAAFAKDLAAKTNGRVTMRIFPGGQLFGFTSALGGIRSGAVDVGFLVPPFNASELKHTNILNDMAVYQPEAFPTLFASNETLLVECKECQQDFASQNAINLGAGATTPWLLLCNKPLRSLSDLKGIKTRVIGGAVSRMASELGMVGVSLAASEIAPALASSQIDCAVGAAAWVIDYSLWGAVKAIVNIKIGISPTTMFAFNRDSFQKISAEDRKIMIGLFSQHLVSYVQSYTKRDADVFEEAKRRGIQILEPADDLVKALNAFREKDIPNVIADVKARGVADPKKIMDTQLANFKKWDALLGNSKRSEAQMVDLLSKEIYAKMTE